jgi:hypothetical protein
MKYDPSICAKVPELFEDCSSITQVAVKLGIGRSTLYEWIDAYPEFKKAMELGLNKSEAAMEKLALEGAKGLYEKFSAPMLIFMMKNRFKSTYGEQKEEEKNAATTLLEQLLLGNIKIEKVV